MNAPIISCCIPAKDEKDPLLKDLIASIRAQDYPQDKIEIIVETRGDSESAKAMAIKRATGDICAMFCADNMIMDKELFKKVSTKLSYPGGASAVFPFTYFYKKDDNSLNRYFSLIGGNDPVCYYLGKNDRWPHNADLRKVSSYQPSYGCNGFFYKAKDIKKTDLDHYYPMDNAMEVKGSILPMIQTEGIWHRTADNFLTFFKKRYKYARDLYCDRTDRRWKMLDTKSDYWKLFLYIIFSLTLIQPIYTSIRGYCKIRDFAWFWHPIVCLGTLITYGILACRNLLKFHSLFQVSAEAKVSKLV